MDWVQILLGYIIFLNIFAMIFVWLKSSTSLIKLDGKKLGVFYFVISILGGFVGVLLAAQMMNYEQDNKLFKRVIPVTVFIEICIILIIVLLVNQ